jgi:hypothetical protein
LCGNHAFITALLAPITLLEPKFMMRQNDEAVGAHFTSDSKLEMLFQASFFADYNQAGDMQC